MSFHISFLVFASLTHYAPHGEPNKFFKEMKAGERSFEISETLKKDIQRYIALDKKE